MNLIIQKKIFYILIVVILLISFKLIRVAPIPGMSLLWNLHIFVFMVIAVISIMHIHKFLKNSLDKLILFFLFFLTILVLIRDFEGLQLNIVYFVLPVFFYYFFRNFSIKHEDIFKIFFVLSYVLIVLFFLDFFSNNVLNLGIFDYSTFHEVSSSMGRTVADMADYKVHPFFGEKWLRVGGVSFAPQPTAVIYASFGVFHYIIYETYKIRKHLWIFFIYLFILFLYNSGTSIIVLLLLVVLSRRNKALNLSLLILSFPLLFIVTSIQYGGVGMALDTVDLMWSGIYEIYIVNALTLNEFFYKSLILGTGINVADNPITLLFEIDFIDILFQIGFINFFLLTLIFYQARKYFFSLERDGINLIPLYYLMLGMILGSIHYQSIFRYPNGIILFGIIGIVSKVYIDNKRGKVISSE